MCIHVQELCRPLKLKAAPKGILMAMANHANENGGSIFPSVSSMALSAGVDPRTAQRAIGTLLDQRLIRIERKPSPGHPTEYSIDLKRVAVRVERDGTGKKVATGDKKAKTVTRSNNVSTGDNSELVTRSNNVSCPVNLSPEPSSKKESKNVPNGTGPEAPANGFAQHNVIPLQAPKPTQPSPPAWDEDVTPAALLWAIVLPFQLFCAIQAEAAGVKRPTEKGIRALIGGWRKSHRDEDVLAAIQRVMGWGAEDPVSAVVKALGIADRPKQQRGAPVPVKSQYAPDEWAAVLRVYQQRGENPADWPEKTYGPRPGDPGCWVPKAVLDRFGYVARTDAEWRKIVGDYVRGGKWAAGGSPPGDLSRLMSCRVPQAIMEEFGFAFQPALALGG